MSSSRGHLPSHTTPGAVGTQEPHARVRKDSEGTLSMNQALYKERKQYRAEHSQEANILSLGTSIIIFKLIET